MYCSAFRHNSNIMLGNQVHSEMIFKDGYIRMFLDSFDERLFYLTACEVICMDYIFFQKLTQVNNNKEIQLY